MIPPQHLRVMLDASPTASLLVQSDGSVIHANRPAKYMWNDDRLFQSGSFISNHLRFSVDNGGHSNGCSWESIIDNDLLVNDMCSLYGVGIRGNSDYFPVRISLARMDLCEILQSDDVAADMNSSADHYLYCLYIQHTTQELSRSISDDNENKRCSATNSSDINGNSFNEACEIIFGEICHQMKLDDHDIILGILDAAFHALFVINEQCIIQMVNAKSTEVFGWSREELLGQNINIIMNQDTATCHDKYVNDYLRTHVKKMIGTQREVTARRKDGSTFPAALGLAEPKGQSGLICGFIRDLTEEKAAQEVIFGEQKLTSGILDASFDGLFLITDHGIIKRVNRSSCELFGWTEDEFVGHNIKMIMPSEHADKHDEYLSQYLSSGVKKMIGKKRELQAVRKDGSTFPCILGLKEVVTNGSTQFVGFVRDITAEKNALNAVKAEQNLLSKILDASFDSLLVINEKGILQMVNEAATKTFGWTKTEFIGRNSKYISCVPLHNIHLYRLLNAMMCLSTQSTL